MEPKSAAYMEELSFSAAISATELIHSRLIAQCRRTRFKFVNWMKFVCNGNYFGSFHSWMCQMNLLELEFIF